MRLITRNLIFEVNEQANCAFLIALGTCMESVSGDFWQLTLQDRENQVDEISIYSSEQQGTLYQDSNGAIHIFYEHLKDTYGDIQDICFEVIIWKDDELIYFKTTVINHQPGLRVLESRCPMICFHHLFGEPEEDILYMPDGLGKRLKNPWIQNTCYSQSMNDYAHAQPDYTWDVLYPAACMAWMGIESGGKFFYIGRHDKDIRLCAFRVQIPHPMMKTRLMRITVAQLPAAQPGETVELPTACIGLLDGDWREGASIYRKFAQTTFFKPKPKYEWVRHMHGFLRIHRQCTWNKYAVLTFEDIPKLYMESEKYGIDTILFFNWWDTPFDAENPIHAISPMNAEKLKEAILRVRRIGGRIITECNATYVVVNSPYYMEYGKEISHLDMHGNDDLALHGAAINSIWRARYPFRQYVHGCCGSQEWRETLIGHAKQMKQFDPDGMFFDCFGAWSCQPCYNDRHDHGNRADAQWMDRRKVFEVVRDICGEEQAFANEVVTDIAASYTQIIHTLAYNLYDSYNDFPLLFRYTFPDVIITNRFINNEFSDFEKQLRYDFMLGMRYDVGEIYDYATERVGGNHYAQIIGEMNSLREQYAEFIMEGKITIIDTSPLPPCVYRTEYVAKDERILRILYNASDDFVKENGVFLQPDEMHFSVFPSGSYAIDSEELTCGLEQRI